MRSTRFSFQLVLGVLIACALLGSLPLKAQAQELGPALDESLVEEPIGGIGLDSVGCTRINSQPVNAVFEQRVVELVNIERAKSGLPPLKRSSELDFAARDHTRDMVEDNYFAHDSYDLNNGLLTKVCTAFERIRLYYPGYSLAGENIAAGYSTPEAVFQGWMGSDGHRKNILKPDYKEIGVGYYSGVALYTHYWAQDFGSMSNVYPVIINNEASMTTSPLVGFYVYGKGVWSEMRTRENTGPWSTWMPFQEYVTFQLTPTNGMHTLTVEMRAAGALTAGAASSDTIELTGMPTSEPTTKIFLPFIKR